MKNKISNLILILGAIILLYWSIIKFEIIKNVYDYPVLGAVYELTAIPSILLIGALPLISAWLYSKNKIGKNILFVSILLSAVTAITIFIK